MDLKELKMKMRGMRIHSRPNLRGDSDPEEEYSMEDLPIDVRKVLFEDVDSNVET